MIFKGHSGSILNMGMKILLKILKGRNKSVLLCVLGNKEDNRSNRKHRGEWEESVVTKHNLWAEN